MNAQQLVATIDPDSWRAIECCHADFNAVSSWVTAIEIAEITAILIERKLESDERSESTDKWIEVTLRDCVNRIANASMHVDAAFERVSERSLVFRAPTRQVLRQIAANLGTLTESDPSTLIAAESIRDALVIRNVVQKLLRHKESSLDEQKTTLSLVREGANKAKIGQTAMTRNSRFASTMR